MYRLGVGDCFLIRLRHKDGPDFKMLIDCGVHMAQPGGSERIKKVAADLKKETGGKFDVVVGTHEHWDHISGFAQAEETFKQMSAGEIWCAWTEDEKDPLRKELKTKRRKALKALTSASAHAFLAGSDRAHKRLNGLLGFFGDGTGAKLTKAAAALKSLSPNAIRYRKPGEPPIELPGLNARVFVLGPPRDKELIKRDQPRSGPDTEVFPFGAYNAATDALDFALNPDLTPFDDIYSVPLEGSKSMAFFQSHYWADHSGDLAEAEREDTSQSWRRIDSDWLDSATTLALDLDSDTNNTSLVLAIELSEPEKNGPVLLFAADAQVGNWLSWQNVKWTGYHGRTITGPDLLRRTLVYKVGHHASHNATLRKLGLELMDTVELALVPTDAKMAETVGWGTLPWPHLLDALDAKTEKRVIRTDRPAPKSLANFKLSVDDLFYEVAL